MIIITTDWEIFLTLLDKVPKESVENAPQVNINITNNVTKCLMINKQKATTFVGLSGKSLDQIAELREKNKLPKVGGKKRQKLSKVKSVKLPERVSTSIYNIFILLNSKWMFSWQLNGNFYNSAN